MKIFITADHHFHHKNIIEYCKRPFKTVEELEKRINKKNGKTALKIKSAEESPGIC